MSREGSFWSNRPQAVACLVATCFLLGALAELPYGYYTLLRLVTCGAAGFAIYCFYSSQYRWAIWVFGVITLLFNPVIPVHLSRQTWQLLDVLAAIVFLPAGCVPKSNRSRGSE